MEKRGCGIICEYNPFHNGHKYQLEKAKELCPFTVCAMSGDFVQRGEPAFQEKEVRAKNACENGGDIILEIPFPFSCFGAEGFARSGVQLLSDSRLCSHIMFGSECADIEVLTDIARFLSKDGFYSKVIDRQKKQGNLSFASARESVVERELGKAYSDVIKNPNDILAVEYIKAIIKLESPLIAVPLKRSTPRGGFDDDFASSGYIRKCIENGGSTQSISRFMPENCSMDNIFRGSDALKKAIHIGLLTKNAAMLENILEVPKGYGYTIEECALKAQSFDEMCRLLSGKKVTEGKIKRMLLFSFFSIEKEVYNERITYSSVLALSETGRKMLKKYRDESSLIIASRIGDIKADLAAFSAYMRSRRASEVLKKCNPAY